MLWFGTTAIQSKLFQSFFAFVWALRFDLHYFDVSLLFVILLYAKIVIQTSSARLAKPLSVDSVEHIFPCVTNEHVGTTVQGAVEQLA